MKLVVIIGAGAVGKMTVGQELAKITDLRLYHGHMDIELVIQVFGRFNARVSGRIREVIFEEFAQSELGGMIFTFMWAFDRPGDWLYIDNLVDIFRQEGAEVCFVELVADQQTRLARHTTPNRLENKPSKRDLDFSTKLLLNEDENYRLTSRDGEFPYENYIKIDNTSLSPDEVAAKIKERFEL